MKLKQVKCTTCGSQVELDHGRKTAFCKACNNSFVVAQGEHLSQVEVDKTKDLKNNRKLLDKAISNDDIDAILTFSDQIRKILPDDYVSTYFHAYASKKKHNPKYMNIFYQNFLFEATERDIDRVIKHMIEKSDLRDYKQVKNYLSYVRKKQIPTYEKRFNERKRLEDNYASIPRDAFICHRSTDGSVAKAVVDTLENDGYKCWISSRNLRPNDNENYWRNIKDAIDKCSVFLVISSQEAMLSNDVQREIEHAQYLKKAKLEIKIDEKPHTSLFKYFFDGNKWIDAYSNFDEGLSELKERFFQKKLEVKKANQKADANKVEKRSKDENYIVRARVENEQGNDSVALDFIEKALDVNVESPDAWWLKFLVNHHFRSTKEFDTFLEDNDSYANIQEILQSKEYNTARKFSNAPEYFEQNDALLERKLNDSLKTIVKRKSKADLKHFLELSPDHEKIKWYHLLFSFDIYSEDRLDEILENEQYVVLLDGFFNSQKFDDFIKSLENTAKYLSYQDRFENFKASLGEKKVKQLFTYNEKIDKLDTKIKTLLKKEKFKRAKKRVKKLKKYGINGEALSYYYMVFVDYSFKNESAMFEALKDTTQLKESLSILKSKAFKQLKESAYHDTLVKNIEETLDETKVKATEEMYENKVARLEKKYYKKYYFSNFLIGLSMIFILYMVAGYFFEPIPFFFDTFQLALLHNLFIIVQGIMLILAGIMILYTGFLKERKRTLKKSTYNHKEAFNIKALRVPLIGSLVIPLLYGLFVYGFNVARDYNLVIDGEVLNSEHFFIYIYTVYFLLVYAYYRFMKNANFISGKIFPEKMRFRLLILPFIMLGLLYLTLISIV